MTGQVIPDIPRFYTAIAEWLSCMMIVALLKPRLEKYRFPIYSAVYLAMLIAFMELTETILIWLWVPCMMVAFISMAGFIHFTAKVGKYESLYYAILAFSSAEVIASLDWQLITYFYTDTSKIPLPAEILFTLIVYGGSLFIEYQVLSRRTTIRKRLNISKDELITAIFIAVVVFSCSNLRFINYDGMVFDEHYREIAKDRTLVAFIGVAILYAHLLSCCNNEVLRELNAVENTLETQYQQYKQSRESIDLINLRYHDMKHQIQYLRSEQDEEKRNEFLDKMENEIKTFELQNKTGNAVLDTILTGRSLYCYKHGITMTSVADGKLLDFMEVADICNIFGNALENAIESVLRIEDKEKRLIHVTVSQLNDFVMIRIENYYEGDLIMEGEDYLTTKENKKNHGYGIKSIKYTADRYDGAVYINTDNNWFDIKIAIPKRN